MRYLANEALLNSMFGGAVDFHPAKFVKRHSLGPKTMGCAVGVELNLDAHLVRVDVGG